ncbi:MAG: thrombospondin type 3 repeat-containing protein, partial [Trueperaceae bacterium]|nr:thrombospondin type 3 repeat-containing protein [Trueperaceae bacterium]
MQRFLVSLRRSSAPLRLLTVSVLTAGGMASAESTVGQETGNFGSITWKRVCDTAADFSGPPIGARAFRSLYGDAETNQCVEYDGRVSSDQFGIEKEAGSGSVSTLWNYNGTSDVSAVPSNTPVRHWHGTNLSGASSYITDFGKGYTYRMKYVDYSGVPDELWVDFGCPTFEADAYAVAERVEGGAVRGAFTPAVRFNRVPSENVPANPGILRLDSWSPAGLLPPTVASAVDVVEAYDDASDASANWQGGSANRFIGFEGSEIVPDASGTVTLSVPAGAVHDSRCQVGSTFVGNFAETQTIQVDLSPSLAEVDPFTVPAGENVSSSDVSSAVVSGQFVVRIALDRPAFVPAGAFEVVEEGTVVGDRDAWVSLSVSPSDGVPSDVYDVSVTPRQEGTFSLRLPTDSVVRANQQGALDTTSKNSQPIDFEVTAADLSPFVAGVDLASTATDGWYGVGDVVRARVTFSEGATTAALADGDVAPVLRLGVGGEVVDMVFDGSGTDGAGALFLEFVHEVVEGQLDEDGVSVGAEAFDMNDFAYVGNVTGKPFDASVGESISAPIVNAVDHRVDGVVPTITSFGVPDDAVYAIGEVLPFTFLASEGVSVSDGSMDPSLEVALSTSEGARIVEAVVDPGASTATVKAFEYSVVAGDEDLDGVEVTALLGASFVDRAGNALVRDVSSVPSLGGVQVDGVVPFVTEVVLEGDAVGRPVSPALGDLVAWRVGFNKVVSPVDAEDFALDVSPVDVSVTPSDLDVGVVSVSPSGVASSFVVTASGSDVGSFDGSLGLRFADVVTVSDTRGNSIADPASFPVDAEVTWVVDGSAPLLSLVSGADVALDPEGVRVPENRAGVGSVVAVDEHEVRFALEGPDVEALSVSAEGTVAFVEGAVPDFEVPADANGDGTYEVTVVATDEASNVTRLPVRVVVVDVPEGPVVTTLSFTDAGPARTAPFDVVVGFREPVVGFDGWSDVRVRGGVVLSAVDVGEDPAVSSSDAYRVTVDAFGAGEVRVWVPSGVAASPAGLPNAASNVLTAQVETDLDGDGVPDSEDPDVDGDGVPNEEDAFPRDPKESKDSDGDGVGDNEDDFPRDPGESKDSDGDGVGNNGDPDVDGDGIPNDVDPDMDGDGVPNEEDDFPRDPEFHGDLDGDGVPDPLDPDMDGDGIPDVNDPDWDNDGVPNDEDAFPRDPEESKDSDGDGVGDNADDFPRDPGASKDTDGDGVPDVRDPDMDGDGIPNEEDAFPLEPDANQDSDGDGVPDVRDAFPNDPEYWADLDGDGVPDALDDDRDGDGVPNDEDAYPDDPTGSKDSDGDGVPDERDAFPNDP